MSDLINLKSATVPALQKALGDSLHLHIKEWGSVKSFIEHSGVSKATLYRVFNGETVGSDVILKIYQTLGKTDVLTSLTAKPKPNPLSLVKIKTPRTTAFNTQATTGEPRGGFALSHIASAKKLGLSKSLTFNKSLKETPEGKKQ